jgi:excisionase family DNA binding protein
MRQNRSAALQTDTPVVILARDDARTPFPNHAPPADPRPLLVTIPETGGLLRIGRTKVYELIEKGSLKRVKIGKSARIQYDSILSLLTEQD